MNTLASLAALASDVLSVAGVPGGALLEDVTKRLIDRRIAQAREILLEEIRRGEKHISQAGADDEFAAILFRYQRAAIEGTARLNLRLLAAVAAGQGARTGFAADEFLAWADVLATLRREELIVVAALWRIERGQATKVMGPSAVSDPIWTQLEAKLIPDPFLTPEEVTAAASACTRTGLVATIGGTWDQAVTFTTTPRLTKLLELAPIEDVLGRDRASRR
jgi:hypothetical protein